ncbi:hypothetical protein SAMN05443428_10141 [Caloramator quimbayensis]|uniref:Uncharacterized protein n=1 Tax=Caloramator quimbayensis TaxID=1147123 RepID=A0A1T4WET8_9CLOT|nr:hypothetical protein [Caloramator quimbayensis]SKA75538.1 hypothetical protein SAMN05443428_10141 [Caloramator quimbayensis]
MIQNVVSTFSSSNLTVSNIIKANSPDLKQIGSIFYLQPEGIQFLGTTAYITQYVYIGKYLNALA